MKNGRMKHRVLMVLLMICFVGVVSYAEAGEESMVVLSREMNQPNGIALSKEGLIYVADTYNNQIKYLDGEVELVLAGRNDLLDGYALPIGGLVDGSVAEAYFNRPRDLAVSDEGIVYVADTDNHVIRKIANGKVTTLAGTGQAGFVDGEASVAQFNKPSGIVIGQDGKLYVADMLNNKIRIIDLDGTVSTMSLSTDQSYGDLNEPSDLVMTDDGSIYVTDSGHQMIKVIKNDTISLVAGEISAIGEDGYGQKDYKDGPALESAFAFPKAITYNDGLVFVADTWNHAIRLIKQDGRVVTLVGDGLVGRDIDPEVNALNGPSGLAVKDNTLYISDRFNNRLLSYDLNYGDPIFDLSLERSVEDDPNKVEVIIEGQAIEYTDVTPYEENGIMYYPVRLIAEKCGAQVTYDDLSRTATIMRGSQTSQYNIDHPECKIINDRLMVPIRQLASDLNVFITTFENSKDVQLTLAN